MLRLRYNPPVDIFPIDPWSFEATRFDAELADRFVCHSETLFALSNGYLGMRGMFEEGAPAREPGVFLNGFYEHRPISYGERAYGFPRLGQSILNCPDGTILRLFVDDEPLLLTQAEILSFRRTLDFRDGTLGRDVRWVTPSGKRMRLRTTRLVSLRHRHLAAISYQLTAEDAEADVVISSELLHRQPLPVDSADPRLAEGFVGRVLHPTGTHCEGLRAILSYRTQSSGLVLGCGMDHRVEGSSRLTTETTCQDDIAAVVLKAVVERGTSALRLQVPRVPLLGCCRSRADQIADRLDSEPRH